MQRYSYVLNMVRAHTEYFSKDLSFSYNIGFVYIKVLRPAVFTLQLQYNPTSWLITFNSHINSPTAASTHVCMRLLTTAINRFRVLYTHNKHEPTWFGWSSPFAIVLSSQAHQTLQAGRTQLAVWFIQASGRGRKYSNFSALLWIDEAT